MIESVQHNVIRIASTMVSLYYSDSYMMYLFSLFVFVASPDLFDASVSLAAHSINVLSHRPIFDTRTPAERRIAKQTTQLQQQLSIPFITLCADVAQYTSELLPRIVAGSDTHLLTSVEFWARYNAGAGYRYIDSQLSRRTGYKALLLQSRFGKGAESLYHTVTTLFARALFNTISPYPKINLALLRGSDLLSRRVRHIPPNRIIGVVTQSLAKSFALLEDADQVLRNTKYDSKEEEFIARLDWYLSRQSLPNGMPNPSELRLDSSNIEREADKALHTYLASKCSPLLDVLVPDSFSSLGTLYSMLYILEGKDVLVDALAYSIKELAVKQFTDPHLLAILVLYASGIETSHLELDGYGNADILGIGKEMLQNPAHASIEESGIRQSPGSMTAIAQKKEARALLGSLITETLYKKIKPNHYRQQPGRVKSLRERLSSIPYLRGPTLLLHGVASGTLLTAQHVVSQTSTSLSEHLVRSLAGKSSMENISRRIVGLLLHPSWRFVIMQLANDLADGITNRSITGPIASDIEKIVGFACTRIFNIRSEASWLFDGRPYTNVSERIWPPLIEKVVQSWSVSMREVILYGKLIDMMHKEGCFFKGDAKFWELYIREWLNRKTTDENRAEMVEELLVHRNLRQVLLELEEVT